jgi:hypothetical protein
VKTQGKKEAVTNAGKAQREETHRYIPSSINKGRGKFCRVCGHVPSNKIHKATPETRPWNVAAEIRKQRKVHREERRNRPDPAAVAALAAPEPPQAAPLSGETKAERFERTLEQAQREEAQAATQPENWEDLSESDQNAWMERFLESHPVTPQAATPLSGAGQASPAQRTKPRFTVKDHSIFDNKVNAFIGAADAPILLNELSDRLEQRDKDYQGCFEIREQYKAQRDEARAQAAKLAAALRYLEKHGVSATNWSAIDASKRLAAWEAARFLEKQGGGK